MENRKVLIVGAEENPSLPIIESLSKKGINVWVASHKRICTGFFSRYVSKRFIYPSPFTDHDGFINEIVNLIKRERFDVTFVTGEQTTFLLSKYKGRFEQYTRLPLVGFSTYMKCRDKSNTMKIASRIGVPTPKTYFPEEDNIKEIANMVDYPVVVKPNKSYGARGIAYPNSPEELIQAYYRIRSEYESCHIQEYIPHSGMQFKAEVLLDYSSEVKAWCVYNKPRYYPPTGGSSTINCTVDRRDILEYAAKILKEIGWYGMGDCDFIEDPRDNIPKLMEINPRFTRSIKICVLAGVDFPYLLYRLAMGEEVPSVLEYKIGIYLRYLFSDIVWFIKSPNRFKAKPNFFWFLGKNLRDEVISFKDPGPAMAYFLSKTLALLNKKERKFYLR
jgi:predicted ATP-grasp superfamily ATP-dependent carboligase